MKVKQLQLQNYGRFDDLTIRFAPTDEIKGNVTIIVGNNGAGKSQILQALATGFSWFVNGLKNKSDGFEIDKKFIKNGYNDTCINLDVDFEEFNYRSPFDWGNIDTDKKTNWQFMAVKDGRNSFFKNKKYVLDKVIKNYRENLTNDIDLSLPLIVYYPVERSIIDNSKADIFSSDFEQFDAYFACTDGFGIDFYDFFKWFKQKEDLENEKQRYSSQQLSKLLEIFEKNKGHQILDGIIDNIQNMETGDHLLNKVRKALELFTDFKNIRIERQGTPTMFVEKDGEKLDVNQLSQGEKSLLALVGDIARRLAILNPSLDNPLQGEGVVLIDEVDLHLHPKWQQNLIDKLTKTFPNVQFILTTHSPHIVSDNPDVLVYALNDGEIQQFDNLYGEDSNALLNNVFDVSYRTPEIDEQFNHILRAISRKQLEEAEQAVDDLSEKISSNNTELLKLRLMLAQAKLAQTKKEN